MHIIYISHYLHEFDNDKLISNHFFFHAHSTYTIMREYAQKSAYRGK